MADLKHITKRSELRDLAEGLGVRPDWHEPGEQEVEAIVFGDDFDNAGFWGRWFRKNVIDGKQLFCQEEMNVLLIKDGEPVAEVNLATLLAWACGFNDD